MLSFIEVPKFKEGKLRKEGKGMPTDQERILII